jgi:hypothetical protein
MWEPRSLKPCGAPRSVTGIDLPYLYYIRKKSFRGLDALDISKTNMRQYHMYGFPFVAVTVIILPPQNTGFRTLQPLIQRKQWAIYSGVQAKNHNWETTAVDSRRLKHMLLIHSIVPLQAQRYTTKITALLINKYLICSVTWLQIKFSTHRKLCDNMLSVQGYSTLQAVW